MKWFFLIIMAYAGTLWSTELSLLPVQVPAQAPIFLDIETDTSYGFVSPVAADVLSHSNYVPRFDERYFMSVFGPRYKAVVSSNIETFDFHQGADITVDVSVGEVDFSKDNPPPIHSMCEGNVDEVNVDVSEVGGKWVRVVCDKKFNVTDWGHVYITYRHLEDTYVNAGDSVQKNSPIGLMGDTGETETVHLHLSVQRLHNTSFINVLPTRIFNEQSLNHLVSALNAPVIEQLKHDENSALFRIHIPFNQTSIRAIRIADDDDDWSKLYDFERISELSLSQNIDLNNIVDGLELFAYPFNRGHSMYRRYIETYELMAAAYPGSIENLPSSFFPILPGKSDSGVEYVLDVRAIDLPQNYNINELFIEVYDIWGNGYRAYGVGGLNTSRVFALVSDDAEEHENGEVSISDSSLDMVDAQFDGNQVVGMQFNVGNVPEDAVITKASIQFTSDKINVDSAELQIEIEASNDPAIFSEEDNNISNRATFQTHQTWNVAPWENVDEKKDEQRTPNLANLINSHINFAEQFGGKVLSFIFSGTGKRVADSDNNFYPHKDPYLYIEYISQSDDLIFRHGFD